MVFYNYTIKKMLKSTSTWVTFAITMLPIWGFTIAMFVKNLSNFSSVFIMISFFIIALPIIFIAYQSIKIFRDEIENKTILSLQTKPISRKGMIFQGLLAILTSLSLMLVFLILIPGILLGIKDKNMFLASISVFGAYFLILSIFSIICFRLSLSFSGKSFIGIIIGAFGVGFYLLFGLSIGIKNISSIDKNTKDFWTKINPDTSSFSGIKTNNINKKNLGNNTYSISGNGTNTAEIKDLYDQAKSNNHAGAYDIIEWFNPTSHWMRMFGAISKSSDKPEDASFLDAMFFGKSVYIENVKKVDDPSGNITSFTFQLQQKDSLPVYYPFILWIAIGAVLIPLSIRSIQKRNIS